MQTQLLIAGRLVEGEGAAEAVLDAASGAQIATVPEASAAQVQGTVAGAEAAFTGWARTAPKDRAGLLLRIAQALSMRGGISLRDWLVTPFIDNVFNSHTVTNYLGQLDSYNPAGPPSQQQNVYTFRPRTFGVTATWHPGAGG